MKPANRRSENEKQRRVRAEASRCVSLKFGGELVVAGKICGMKRFRADFEICESAHAKNVGIFGVDCF
jgi:hypothetical protein